ncbi:MAG: hypothetical protein QXP94_05420 [Thermofilaceae archaeon]
MTGPGEGKIALKAKVYLGSRRVDCDVYLHVKGYSLARVTHLDVESDVLNEAIPPRASMYATAYTQAGALRVRFREPLEFGFGPVREIAVECPELAQALGPVRDVVYVGGKEGGIFIGFRREQIRKLEELATRLGVPPRKRLLPEGES